MGFTEKIFSARWMGAGKWSRISVRAKVLRQFSWTVERLLAIEIGAVMGFVEVRWVSRGGNRRDGSQRCSSVARD